MSNVHAIFASYIFIVSYSYILVMRNKQKFYEYQNNLVSKKVSKKKKAKKKQPLLCKCKSDISHLMVFILHNFCFCLILMLKHSENKYKIIVTE